MTSRPFGTGRPPQQARSLVTQNEILSAAQALLLEGGWDAFTIAEISRRAGVSVGAIYQRFGDKNGLFAVIHDEHLARFQARVRTDFDPQATAESVPADTFSRVTITTFGRIFEDFGELNGILLLNSNRIPGLGEHGVGVMAEMRDRVTQLLHLRAEDMTPGDPHRAITVCYRMAFSTFMDFATFTRDAAFRQEMSWTELIESVADACTAYLFGRITS